MFKVGIMTFHASYNFGSVMQAWTTQHILDSFGYKNEIINFRMDTQKDKYSLFPIYSGIKLILRNIIQIYYIFDKYKSNKKYEEFITKYLNITKECNNKEDLKKLKKFDIYLSGSDQIWAYSVPEFMSANSDFRDIYYFSFTDGYKISYASSTGTATYEQLLPYKKHIEKFSYISVREKQGRNILKKITEKNVFTVLDPTFLVSSDEWKKISQKSKKIYNKKYILIYSLQGRKKSKKWKNLINTIRQNEEILFVTVNPFAPIVGKDIENRSDTGPIEILNLFSNAEYIFTDTFHGMLFSIHFRKPFTVFEENEADFRKKNVLEMFNLKNRETNSIDECLKMYRSDFQYCNIENIIDEKIRESKEYLKNALDGYSNYKH